MAVGKSYLKFDGLDDRLRSLFVWPTSNGSLTFTLFFRILYFPRDTSPIIKLWGDSTNFFGVWLYHRDQSDGKEYVVKMNGYHNGAQYTLAVKPTSSATAPFALGRIYKLQCVFDWDFAGGTGFNMGAFVDGALVGQFTNGTGSGLNVFGSDPVLTLGATTESASDRLTAISSVRASHIDIVQFKIEIDRTITYTSGVMDVPDADSDPWTNLTIAGSATDGGLYLLDEGSGTTVGDSSSFGRDISLAGDSTDPSWATAVADPSEANSGEALWTFESIFGYPLRHSDASDAVPLPIYGPTAPADKTASEVRLRTFTPDWSNDGTSVDLWSVTTGLSASATQSFESGSSLRANNASAVTDYDLISLGGAETVPERWFRARFYDPGGTDTNRLQRLCFFNSSSTIILSVGVHISQSSTHYVTFVNGPGHVASSVAMSVGWHEFAIYALNASGSDVVRFYIDGVLVRTVTGTSLTGAFARMGLRQAATGSNGDGYWDDWVCSGGIAAEKDGHVPSAGSLVFPRFQPTKGVRFFRDVIVTSVTAGGSSTEVGAVDVEFRHSINGGSSFGSWTSATQANLRALDCVGNGDDVIEVRATLTGGMDNMSSGALRSVLVKYEPATSIDFPDEEFRNLEMTGVC